VVQIYQITNGFPREEKYGLTDQLRRSANSVCANIAEGFSRYHAKDKIKFYYNARGSIGESKSHIMLSREIGYLSQDVMDKLLNDYESVKMLLNAMINSIESRMNRKAPT
jgi:four helix bundle protein